MLTRLSHLALEVTDLDAARGFYADRFGLTPVAASDREVVLPVGETDLCLRRPDGLPRGGLHTHFAFSAAPGTGDGWRARLADLDPETATFGDVESLYVYDPDGNCVEVGGLDPADGDGTEADPGPPTGIFEVVLEVAALDAAVERFEALGFDPVDRGSARRRMRLRGPMDLELWEPHLGIADARGGVHVDLGFETADPDAAAAALAPWTAERVALDDGVRVRDADGHWLTFRR
ncbi:VOC family protein [Haloplanus halophilus]|uniref:VOC family protein n=1 Tax=Haloplanus halophilus TaxID=2949993 RepID=UPI00203FD908|nr:VOC family protein [Haloplanus sp. GDY1]